MDLFAAYRQMYAHLQWQANKIKELESGLDRLRSEVEQLSRQKPVNVERIEYHFDQLKIDTLEGTLNVGISPGNGKSIEELMANGQEIQTGDTGEAEQSERIEQVRDAMNRYLSSDCLNELRGLEEKHQITIGQEYRLAMLNDLRNQMDGRIRYYCAANADIPGICEKLRRDIRAGMELHVLQLKEGGGKHESDGGK